jgi:flagellar biogenesis protein FliO
MELIETLSLGGKKELFLVTCGGNRFLVGCASEGVQVIAHVPGRSAAADTEWTHA